MKNLKTRSLFALTLILALSFSCGSDGDDGPETDNFDRSAMLANWADNIIIPAYQAYSGQLANLKTSTTNFITTPDQTSLEDLRAQWLSAYRAWQSVSMFEIGKAETLTLRNFTNIFPADASEIDGSINSGSYNLTLPSTNDEQGFPALDYLINGLGASDADIIAKYTDTLNGQAHRTYLSDLVDRLQNLTSQVLDDWTSGYRDDFVNNNGSSATSSVNKLINDYLFYYEKSFRAGKVGIPAGVFSGNPLNTTVEAFYKEDISKMLLVDALNAFQDFFNGKQFNGTSTGESLKSYLDFLNTIKEGENLSGLINTQLNAARASAEGLNESFVQQIADDNTRFLATYDELQKNVVLLKVDMLQALSVKVDFVDADGD
ncbi:MAG: imelysin family protein [Roseivirga sp.]|nr:imelysin family protein [Roseivirga sp.]